MPNSFWTKETKIGAFSFGALALLGIVWIFASFYRAPIAKEFGPPVPAAGEIGVEGMMVCLPHRETSGPQTLECAFGLKDDNGLYYALRDTDPSHKNVASAPMNARVKVFGIFTPGEDQKYQSAGIIEVANITPLSKPAPSGGSGPKPIPTSQSGIRGNVLLGPTCPVQTYPPDPDCADKPYPASLVITTPDGARVIKAFSSDAEGNFKVEVPPGEYSIRSAAAANILPYCATNESVRVTAGAYTAATVYCDTGIR